MRHIIPISGKDSLATAIVQTTIDPNLDYEFIFNDTYCELPETYEWLKDVESFIGKPIKRFGYPLEDLIEKYNGFLPSGQQRYCTRLAKIKPTEEYFKNVECTIYYGLRADEKDRVGYVPWGSSKIIPKYPLIDLNIDIGGVYSILSSKKLLPPSFFWKRLYDAVEPRLTAFEPGWQQKIEPWRFNIIFAGRIRANCYFCFWQRKREWLWLRETHPDLFEKAKSFEKSNYFWIKDYPLTRLDDPTEQDRIFQKHKKYTRSVLLDLLGLRVFKMTDSEISNTSCGLLCGK